MGRRLAEAAISASASRLLPDLDGPRMRRARPPIVTALAWMAKPECAASASIACGGQPNGEAGAQNGAGRIVVRGGLGAVLGDDMTAVHLDDLA